MSAIGWFVLAYLVTGLVVATVMILSDLGRLARNDDGTLRFEAAAGLLAIVLSPLWPLMLLGAILAAIVRAVDRAIR